MNKLSIYIFLLISGILLISACSDDNVADSNLRKDIPMSRSDEQIVEADNVFAYKLLDVLNKTETEHNIVFSPLSLSIALNITANCATGETRKEILSVLGVEKEDIANLNSFNCRLLRLLPELDKTINLKIANSIWYPNCLSKNIRSEFQETISNYNLTLSGVDEMASKNTTELINEWCADNTGNMIERFLESDLSSETIMALMNAIYFKGAWTERFNKERTLNLYFTNEDGTISRTEMMNEKDMKLHCYSDEKYSAASFPFGNGAYSMIFILPEKEVTVSECIESINHEDISKLAKGGMYMEQLNVRLPKFTVSYSKNLNDILKDMGIKQAFDQYSEFQGLWTNVSANLGQIRQAAKISIDEDGAEVAAVTGSDMFSEMPMKSKDFFVDRPFLFIITENSTGLPIFMGRVTKL